MLNFHPLFMKTFYLIKKLHLLSYVFFIFCMTICLFPHLFPDFVVYAMTNDTLETVPSNNLPNIEETTTTDTSHFPNPIQKEGALLTGYVAY
jgi:hypothetical protein